MSIHNRLQFSKSAFIFLKAPEEKVASKKETFYFSSFNKAILKQRFVNIG
jgi:hypothetical protein